MGTVISRIIYGLNAAGQHIDGAIELFSIGSADIQLDQDIDTVRSMIQADKPCHSRCSLHSDTQLDSDIASIPFQTDYGSSKKIDHSLDSIARRKSEQPTSTKNDIRFIKEPSTQTSSLQARNKSSAVHSQCPSVHINRTDAQPSPVSKLVMRVPTSDNRGHSKMPTHSTTNNMSSLGHNTPSRYPETDQMRRCMSSRGFVCAMSSSPYSFMMYQKERIEAKSQLRLLESRRASSSLLSSHTTALLDIDNQSDKRMKSSSLASAHSSYSSTSSGSSGTKKLPPINEGNKKISRNLRRNEHNQAVINDLCEIVADLSIAESSLLLAHHTRKSSHSRIDLVDDIQNPHNTTMKSNHYDGTEIEGEESDVVTELQVSQRRKQRELMIRKVREFVEDFPIRYVFSVQSPSEVLVHMRLIAVARSDEYRAAVHIVKIEKQPSKNQLGDYRHNSVAPKTSVILVTISCSDRNGLLEYITKLLSSCGSRVLDADVMTTTDNIALDRFTVEMSGRLRLDKLQEYIEIYLRKNCRSQFLDDVALDKQLNIDDAAVDRANTSEFPLIVSLSKTPDRPDSRMTDSNHSQGDTSGPIYIKLPSATSTSNKLSLHEELQNAVPLSQVVSSVTRCDPLSRFRSSSAGKLMNGSKRTHTLSPPLTLHRAASCSEDNRVILPTRPLLVRQPTGECAKESEGSETFNRPLVNRDAMEFSVESSTSREDSESEDVPKLETAAQGLLASVLEQPTKHVVSVLPIDELMLVEKLGQGRISTIYRAVWTSKTRTLARNGIEPYQVALKVVTAKDDRYFQDISPVDELKREADIASQLQHENLCKLVGVSFDSEIFCLAYEYCEGGSLLSLLSDTSKCYEYLPIAMDIANGMAYLHSKNVIHRDLKPSNVLLTKHNRAKVSDFGMSVAYTGQELTAETGTYRWMAPEVIRHESYSSNADVYSFGIVLWQLVTRSVPFATITPVQTAYAVAHGHRPEIPQSTPSAIRKIIENCWDEDSQKRPSFTYIAMSLADYACRAFSPGNVGAQTVRIANEIIARVEGNSTVNVDFSTPVFSANHRRLSSYSSALPAISPPARPERYLSQGPSSLSNIHCVGLEI